MYSYLPHTSQERLCTVLSYYNYSQQILPRNVYVHFSLITIIANTSFPVTFMYISLLLRLQPIHPSRNVYVQFSLITIIAYTIYILPRNVYVHYDYSQCILPSNVYVQFSLITIKVNTVQCSFITITVQYSQHSCFPGAFVYSYLLLPLQPIFILPRNVCTVLSYYYYSQYYSFLGMFMYSSLLLQLQSIFIFTIFAIKILPSM